MVTLQRLSLRFFLRQVISAGNMTAVYAGIMLMALLAAAQ